jgi:hypothetical protein
VLWKVPRRIIRPVIRAKNLSTWFSHELIVTPEGKKSSVSELAPPR